jgi:hypothetical protein
LFQTKTNHAVVHPSDEAGRVAIFLSGRRLKQELGARLRDQ